MHRPLCRPWAGEGEEAQRLVTPVEVDVESGSRSSASAADRSSTGSRPRSQSERAHDDSSSDAGALDGAVVGAGSPSDDVSEPRSQG
jgi:hypothetical protein